MPFSLTPISPPFTGRYAEQADIEDVFGMDNIATWSQLDNDAVGPDTARLLKSLAYADAAIDDALRGGACAVPLASADGSVPRQVRTWAATIAGIWLYQSRGGRAGDKEADRYAQMLAAVYQQLCLVKAGTLVLTAMPANARLHSPRNLDAIAASLARFGQQKPIVIDANNVCRAGNGTMAAAQSLGWTEIQAVRTELTGGEATAYAIVDNRSAELAEWDKEMLSGVLADPEIGDLGFNAEEMAEWLDTAAPVSELEEAESETVGESFQVIAECEDEDAQRELYERLTQEGYPCRVLTL